MDLKVVKDGMRIFPARIYKFADTKGFSLLEILVAISLIGIIAILGINFAQDSRSRLEATLSEFDRAIRYASNEAVFRNAIVRLRFLLDEEPQQYIVEYGKGSNFVLLESVDVKKLSISDRSDQEKRRKKFDAQFSVTPYFEDGAKSLGDFIKVYGVGSVANNSITTEGEVSIFFYPSGEKDTSIIFLNSDEELASLKIPPFEDSTYDEYYTFNETELNFLEDNLSSRSEEIFSQWLKE